MLDCIFILISNETGFVKYNSDFGLTEQKVQLVLGLVAYLVSGCG